jgi:DNA-binding response OmpR family regulator
MPTTPQERILVVDDEDLTRHSIATVLKNKGYRVLEAANGKEALDLAIKDKPALVIMDVEMPEMGGLTAIERLRELGVSLPVLVLSGRVEIDQRVQGLDAGADDYLVKPFAADELLARVKALLRREKRHSPARATLRFGAAVIDLTRRSAKVEGKTVRLSRIEYSILELLSRKAGQPVSREEMLDVAWGYTYLPSTRTVDTHIWRLRKKLGDTGKQPRWLKNIPGAGYVLELEDPEAEAQVFDL